MAPDKDQRCDPVPPIPTYDEAISGSSRSAAAETLRTPTDGRGHYEIETQSLLNTRHTLPINVRGRWPAGYFPPTVESENEEEDDDSIFSSEGDDDTEAAHVRREMQELDMEEGEQPHSLASWGKRMGFSLPQFRWSWRLRLPKFHIRLGQESESGGGLTNDDPEVTRLQLRLFTTDGWAMLQVLSRVIAVVVVMGFIYALIMSDLFSNMARKLNEQLDPDMVRMHIQSTVNAQNMRDTVKHFSSYAHLAGTEGDYALAVDTRNKFEKYGLEHVTVDEYYVYLNYPRQDGRTVEMYGADGKVKWTAKLDEDEKGGEAAGRQTLAFHGHSKSGDVMGPLVYVNYGSREDFKRLHDSGINTKGAIALVRYYGSEAESALKIKAAELAGFSGCLLFSDPADDGFLKGEVAPKGRFMPEDGVQRGSVSLKSWVVGDVLTPGWASKKQVPRINPDQSAGLVKIPSLPLAWRDAKVLLQHIQGLGLEVPEGWTGGVPGVGETWWTGNLSSPMVRLRNEQDENEQQPIWNVYGSIIGVEQAEKKVIIGNHRDAWTFGSSEPHSGTAVMMEMVRIFGDLVSRGWRPLRTIEFMSWDAEEYNLIGSTEYVEQNEESLRKDAFVYINLDTAIWGNQFFAAGSPVFRKLLLQVLNRIQDPNQNATLRDLWDNRNQQLGGLSTDSDYVAFQDIVGTSSLNLYFGGDRFPYHSSYETFDWMDRVGDPGFTYHTLLGKVLGLLIHEFSARPVLPFDMAAYADAMTRWIGELENWAANKGLNQKGNAPLNFGVLHDAVNELAVAVQDFEKWETGWETTIMDSNGWETAVLGRRRCEYNSRMASFETDLLDSQGIPNRTQFKHVVFGPQLWSGHDEGYFPSIRDTILAGEWTLANQTVDRVAAIIKEAAAKLVA